MTSGDGSVRYGDFSPPHEEEISTEALAADREALGGTAAANPAVGYYVRYRHVGAVSYGVLREGIGYVVMDRVARNAAQEMNAALQELAHTLLAEVSSTRRLVRYLRNRAW